MRALLALKFRNSTHERASTPSGGSRSRPAFPFGHVLSFVPLLAGLVSSSMNMLPRNVLPMENLEKMHIHALACGSRSE